MLAIWAMFYIAYKTSLILYIPYTLRISISLAGVVAQGMLAQTCLVCSLS